MQLTKNSFNHFSSTGAAVHMQRSRFQVPNTVKTSIPFGKLVPIEFLECIPGMTISQRMTDVVRLTPSINATMDNIRVDYYNFFVPFRLVWNHWKEFCGENEYADLESNPEYVIPFVNTPVSGWPEYSTADYLGLPTKVNYGGSSALYARGYGLIWNEWFRDQNIENRFVINTGDSADNSDTSLMTTLLPVNRLHDYFSSCLPWPQKGLPVQLPLGSIAPVVTGKLVNFSANALRWREAGRDATPSVSASSYLLLEESNFGPPVTRAYITEGSAGAIDLGPAIGADDQSVGLYPSNLYADLSSATAATINQIRLAFQTQRYLEKLALGGSRYTEIVRTFFGVVSPDARLQRPEYLGGSFKWLNMDQVAQTSSTDSTSPIASVGGLSRTSGQSNDFTYSTVEDGFILTLCCARVQHSYQQGVPRAFIRKNRLDFYVPTFAHIGEQPLPNICIYASDNLTQNYQAFGYQEPWVEYKDKPSKITGQMRSNATQSLDAWHYGDNYEALPTLSPGWLHEPSENVDRTLAVNMETTQPLIVDALFERTIDMPMPVYNDPGLIDHF